MASLYQERHELPVSFSMRPSASHLGSDEAVAPTGEQLLEVAVHAHSRLIYRVSYSILRNHHDAEDLAQETFVRAHSLSAGNERRE
jgi:hypothetical protein